MKKFWMMLAVAGMFSVTAVSCGEKKAEEGENTEAAAEENTEAAPEENTEAAPAENTEVAADSTATDAPAEGEAH